jgi:nitroreductase
VTDVPFDDPRRASVDHAITHRRTRKILDGTGPDPAAFEVAVRESIRVAGHAPFHYMRTPEVPEPWRFTVLFRQALLAFRARMGDALAGKLPAILEGAGAMVTLSYLPETDETRIPLDWEHMMAAGAAAQNLLVATEARGIGSYWCSAKFMATDEALRAAGIPGDERYLGTLFLGVPLPPEKEAVLGIAGKMREKRTPPDAGWCRILSASEIPA